MVLGQLAGHLEKNKIRFLLHAIYRNKLQMDQWSKCEKWKHTSTGGKLEWNYLCLGWEERLSNYDWKSRLQQKKNGHIW